MTSRPWLAMLALTAVACGRKGARPADFDSATAAALAPPPGTPTSTTVVVGARAEAFDVGHELTPDHQLLGGVASQFTPSDTLAVSVTVQNPAAGNVVSARIRTGNRTIDSAATIIAAVDSSHISRVGLRFASAKPWPKGTYQLEVFLGTVSQGSKEFTITPR